MALKDGALIAFSIGLYSTVSISIVFLNRTMFGKTFPFPVFISWFQQFVGCLFLKVLGIIGEQFPSVAVYPNVQVEWSKIKGVSPLTLSFVAMIGLSNTCLKHTPVSAYLIARALTIFFNLLLSMMILRVTFSARSWMACGVVMLGFLVGSLDPTTLSLAGILAGVLASFFQALYNIQIKRCLPVVNDDQNELMFYNLFISSILFVPCIFLFGDADFWKEFPYKHDPPFWPLIMQLVISSLLGVGITFASYLCVKVTSPVTYNVVGYAKSCLQSIIGIAVFHEPYSRSSLSGLTLTLLGSYWYSRVKMAEAQAAVEAPDDLEMKNKSDG
ncbi:MAG: hypothetical protein KVP17_005156 [Porospora cf. gigantea B]|uniref:uncharacterized protein n=1 Tax=Porospora cf. gigantea B TaxID=2853592 RepID=UPI003571EF40|nr:MAG: hypothetical protein KVP17_005156 [Porospora cf. gigantea B]